MKISEILTESAADEILSRVAADARSRRAARKTKELAQRPDPNTLIGSLRLDYTKVANAYSTALSYLEDYYLYGEGSGNHPHHEKPDNISDSAWANKMYRESQKYTKQADALLSAFKRKYGTTKFITAARNSAENYQGLSVIQFMKLMPNPKILTNGNIDSDSDYHLIQFINEWPKNIQNSNFIDYDEDGKFNGAHDENDLLMFPRLAS